MNSYIKKDGNISYTVDFRTELLSIILILSDKYKYLVGNKMIPLNNKYIYDRIKLKFEKFKNHRTINLFNQIIDKHKYFNYDAPVTLFLSLDDNLKCSNLNDYLYIDILNKDNMIYDFIESLNDFSIDINFYDYYKSNKEEYMLVIDELYKKHDSNNVIVFLNKFFKNDKKELIVNAIPFNSMSNYSSNLGNKVYSNIGITQFSKEDNLYKDWEWHNGDMALVSLHEFCHSYVNPLTDKYLNDDNLDFIVDEPMKKFGYDDYKTVINENIVRSIVLFYENIYLKERFDEYYKRELNLGFKIVSKFLEILDKIDNYDDFVKFYISEIINVLNKIKNII